MRRILPALVALTLASTLAACSDGVSAEPAEGSASAAVQQSQPSTEPPADDGAPTEADLRAYFDAIATDDPEQIQTAVDLASPGSNAAAYAVHQAASSQAYRDAGSPRSVSTVKVTDGGFEMCTSDGRCSKLTDIKHENGKVADFTAGDSALAGRIILGNGEVTPLGDVGEARFISAYRTIAGQLIAVFEVRATVDLWVSNESNYKTPEGRQSQAIAVIGPQSLAAGALANFAVGFDGAALGGELTLTVWPEADGEKASATFLTL